MWDTPSNEAAALEPTTGSSVARDRSQPETGTAPGDNLVAVRDRDLVGGRLHPGERCQGEVGFFVLFSGVEEIASEGTPTSRSCQPELPNRVVEFGACIEQHGLCLGSAQQLDGMVAFPTRTRPGSRTLESTGADRPQCRRQFRSSARSMPTARRRCSDPRCPAAPACRACPRAERNSQRHPRPRSERPRTPPLHRACSRA